MRRRVLSFLVMITILISMVPTAVVPVAAVDSAELPALSALRSNFPQGSYWNHNGVSYETYNANRTYYNLRTTNSACNHREYGDLHCSYDSWNYSGACGCNSFSLSTQCMGFARLVCNYLFGSIPNGNGDAGNGWSSTTFDNLKSGDYIRYRRNSDHYGHSVIVVSKSGDSVTVLECNANGKCEISWTRTITKATFNSYYYKAYLTHSGNSAVAPEQYEVDTRYPTPFQAHTLSLWSTSNGKTQVYSSVNGASSGNIYNGYNSSDDNCTIEEVYTNGWCKVTVPGIDGARYCPLSVFIDSGSYSPTTKTVSDKTITYIRRDGATSYGYVGAGDTVTVVGSYGEYSQVIYPLKAGGYKCGWAKLSAGAAYEVDYDYPTPFQAYTLNWWSTSDGKTPVYDAINGTRSGYIYNGYNDEDDLCTIEEVYTNGWCKVTVPGLSGYRYCELSVFVKDIGGYNIWTVNAPQWTQAYRRADHGSPRGYLDAGDHVYVISETDSMYQVVYPTSSVNHSRWVDRCTLKHTYNSSAVKATCTAQGYTVYTCSACGDSYTDNYVSANGHSYSTVVISPSCTAQGYTEYICSVCGDIYTGNYTNALGHNYKSTVVAPTCTSNGYTNYSCSNCGDAYTGNSTAAANHSYKATVVSPTCTAQGYTTYKCSDCGASYTGDHTNATGHNYSYSVTVAPTYSMSGTLNGICSACTSSSDVTLPVLGSSEYSYKVVNEASYTSEGKGTYVWSNTDYGTYSFDVIIPKLDSVLDVISVNSLPTKTTYYIGESLDTTGLSLKLTYSDGSVSTITSGFTVSGFDSAAAGTKSVYVSYMEKTTKFSVTVIENVTVSAKYGLTDAIGTAGSTVDVYIFIEENPGIISLRNTVSYDTTALELVGVENTGLLGGFTAPSTTFGSPYTLRWADSLATENNESDGNIVKLTFKIKDSVAAGTYSVSVTHVESRNTNGTKVAFVSCDSVVTVIDYVVGDADGDGEVSDWDAIILNRYLAGWDVEIAEIAADVDGDGEISDWDAIVLERYLAGWQIELG